MNVDKKYVVLLCLLGLFSSCQRHVEDLEPKISYIVQDRYLKSLPSPFPPLTDEEKKTDWGKEYFIGSSFAASLDLYQAITAFKRAHILLSEGQRKLEVEYEIVLCYYLGKKYQDVISYYEKSNLRTLTPEFGAFHDLLILLYDSYIQLDEEIKAHSMLEFIHEVYPETSEKLAISTALAQADLCTLRENEKMHCFIEHYDANKKSVTLAKSLNALLPGAGYLYLGQRQSAFTAFLLNGAFIAAAYECFHHGNIPAGIIVTSFEAGWYFGGIYGAGEEAKFYNERLYECNATPMMNREGLFPVFMLKYAF